MVLNFLKKETALKTKGKQIYDFEKLEEDANKMHCCACGKTFDVFDYQESFVFDKHIGFGSKHDGEHIRFQLCCDCFDNIFDTIAPIIKNIVIEEYD